MKHGNIAFFIPHNGCPHQCSFCNQRRITGQTHQPTPQEISDTLKSALENSADLCKNLEIAFFGGSFTAIDREYMLSLLKAANPFLKHFKGIRISTRPDYIDDEILSILKEYGVTTIELGAQSMSDNVLNANNRGHSSQDVVNASLLIKDYTFNLGLQMMTGLYMATAESDLYTASEFIKLKPDCVRIYPTVVMKDTELASLYNSGKYIPYSLQDSVELCSEIMLNFYTHNIDVIRVGLHYSESLVNGDIAGNYHPAFKELCENKIFLNKLLEIIIDYPKGDLPVIVNPNSVSKLIGQNKANIKALSDMGYNIKFLKDKDLGKYDLIIKDYR